ncbi:rRNA cytosine-C5-methyltransferase [Niabella terrae]
MQSLRGLPGYNESEFLAAHDLKSPVTSVRLNPRKPSIVLQHWESRGLDTDTIPWTRDGYYLSERPSFTFDPLFHAGAYYVQDASSMFVEQALKQTVDLQSSLRVLDLCAAPGGKSTLIQSLLNDSSMLVSNEVIRQRVSVLKENIIKWGSGNVVVTHNDPRDFSKFKGYFDVIVVDAPCSGSGLFRKDPKAVEEWSENNVALCSQRQQRILADVLPALKPEGILIYATCSYSPQEDEHILDWLSEQYSLESVELKTSSDWKLTPVVTANRNFGYRFWPQQVKGEGFFLAVFRNQGLGNHRYKPGKQLRLLSKKSEPLLQSWVHTADHRLIDIQGTIYAWPVPLIGDYSLLMEGLRVIYSGTQLGTLAHHKFLPAHALAMSSLHSEEIARIDIDYDTAISFLRKSSIKLPDHRNGWQLLCWNQQALGWVNVLDNRVNNYYPKEWRILKAKS